MNVRGAWLRKRRPRISLEVWTHANEGQVLFFEEAAENAWGAFCVLLGKEAERAAVPARGLHV